MSGPQRLDGFEAMWRDLAPLGRVAGGGYRRQPFTAAERETRAWFTAQAEARGLRLEDDGFGNVAAWWEPAGPGGPAVLTGSHLDSVVDGGGYDGPLGVVSALAAIDVLRERGVVPARRLGVAVFAEEEGSRFPVACLGSRLATGALDWERARRLRDPGGTALEELVEGDRGSRLLEDVGAYVELHVEQGRGLVGLGSPVGVATGIWPHGRYRLDVTGRGDHAGTTRMEDRHDPMLTVAMTVLAAHKQARLTGQRATVGRLRVTPGGTNAIAAKVTAWLDARAETTEALHGLVADIERQAVARGARDGTDVVLTAESVTAPVHFDSELAARLAGLLGGLPLLPTAAGHDAGIVSQAGTPTAMLFVRNPTGVSHAPEEHAELADCLAGVEALADALADLVAGEVEA